LNEPLIVNIAEALSDMARSRPHALAVVCPSGRDRQGRARHTHRTFQQLDRDSNAIARGLEGLGVSKGARTALMVKPSLEFFALTFALFKAGAVPVMIDPGIGVKNIGRCLADAEPTAFIGTDKALAARAVFGWGRESIRVVVSVSKHRPRNGRTLDDVYEAGNFATPYMMARVKPDEVAAILFTSGSTGPPKGAVYTHAIFAAQVEILRSVYNIQPGEIDLCTFPLFALFGPALGMTAVIPEMDASRPARVDPTKIIEAIEDFGVTNMFGSPALVRRVGFYGAEKNIKLPSLRRVISAGAPVPAKVVERFATMLAPNVQLFTPYGATEALPVASIGSDELLLDTRRLTDLGHGVCIGRPVPGVRVEIIRISDAPIPAWSGDLLVADGEVGEFVASGPNVTREYFHLPDATALAKIQDPATGGFFHRMGDLGYRDGKGRLWFCGRKSHRVQIQGATLYTIPSEAIFNTHPEVSRSALVGVGIPGSMRPVLCVEPTKWSWLIGRKRLRRELLAIGATSPYTSAITTILFHPSFPVDIRHNSKIFREKLAAWATRRLRRQP
jgi:acyl-CoA synthetase (AMP-forming)/AMP-acid ligase II